MTNFDASRLDELNGPVVAHRSSELIELVAAERTDLFCPPDGGPPTVNAPALLAEPCGDDFVLSTSIEVELRSTFDAGALLLWRDEQTWAKLAVELSPERRATIVTVVTDARSDDCNSTVLDRPGAYVRLARIGDAFAFHLHSADRWNLIRHFSLGEATFRPGFLAQSPTGQGCTARFRHTRFEARRLGDLRDGT
jgi:regulation of enolase protein 1 (concanavalin A-like superfamily)